MSASPALAFEDVWLRLGQRQVLRGVTLAVHAGEMVALAGPNGAGKTTLFRVASRLRRADRGRVEVGGADIEGLTRRELALRMAVVPQDVTIPFPFSAGQVVLMGRSPHTRRAAIDAPGDVELARAAMEEVGVSHLADRPMPELSGGERQLVLAARALAQDPQVLLLDEPTAHLDLRHRIELLDRVRSFVARGRSALVVSHDLDLAARTCDRLALLSAGTLVAQGRPRDVIDEQTLHEVFGIHATVVTGPDGAPLVVPRS